MLRLVSVTPSNTELLAFLGLGHAIVGIDDWSDWPADVAERATTVGPDLQIDVERVAALSPELVVASLSVPGMDDVVRRLRERGLETLVLHPRTLGDVVEDVRTLGARVGSEAHATRLAEAMVVELERIERVTSDVAPVRVYWEWWPKPAITAGAPGWMTEVMRTAGAINVFGMAGDESPKVDAAGVIARAPDAAVLCWCGALQRVQSVERFRTRPGWADLVDRVDDRVHLMLEALFGRPGPRLVEGARHLAATLHPGLSEPLGTPYRWVPDGLKDRLRLTELHA